MQTVTVELFSPEALELLQKLEQLNVLRMVNNPSPKEENRHNEETAEQQPSKEALRPQLNKSIIINKLSEHKETLEKNFHITRLGLFGSYATDSYHADSDVDLVYELQEGKSMTFLKLGELETFVKDLLKVDEVDLVNQKYMNPIIKHEMNKVVVYV